MIIRKAALGAMLLLPQALLAPLAMAEVPRVVTDIPPVHALVAQVMGDLGQPGLLVDQGGDAHHMSLRPSHARALQQADLVVWLGPEMTPWMVDVLNGAGQGVDRLGLLAAAGTHLRHHGAPGAAGQAGHDHDHGKHDEDGHDHAHHGHHGHGHHDHAHHDHGDHDEGHEHADSGHDGHDHAGVDAHAWLDPENARLWLGLIAEELAARDAENADRYRANAQHAAQRLAALDADLAARLQPIAERAFVTGHDAYGYFTDHYGLAAAGAVAGGDAASPGARSLSDLRARLKTGQIVCAFPETGADPRLMATVVEGTAARLGEELDPEGAMLQPGPDLHVQLLGGLADRLIACLGTD